MYRILIAPTAMDRLKADDIMVIIGSNDNIARFEHEVVNINQEG